MHPDYISCLNCIASVYDIKGEYDKSLDHYLLSLERSIQILGENHPTHAIYLNNIGSTYDNKGDYDNALKHYFKSL
jgi:tetratricopeptide (TPR) repeat protein